MRSDLLEMPRTAVILENDRSTHLGCCQIDLSPDLKVAVSSKIRRSLVFGNSLIGEELLEELMRWLSGLTLHAVETTLDAFDRFHSILTLQFLRAFIIQRSALPTPQ